MFRMRAQGGAMFGDEFVDRSDHAGRIAGDDHTGRDVARDDRAGAHDGVGTDFDPAQDNGLDTDEAPIMDHGPSLERHAIKEARSAQFRQKKRGGGIVAEDRAVSQNAIIADLDGIALGQ